MAIYKSKTNRTYEIGNEDNCIWDKDMRDWKLIDDTQDGFVSLKRCEDGELFAIDYNYQTGCWVGRPTSNGSVDHSRSVEL